MIRWQGEFVLVLQGPLDALARRPTDGSFVLRNDGPLKKTYKLNVIDGAESKGAKIDEKLVKRDLGYEYQR